jgi:hypothetical protein
VSPHTHSTCCAYSCTQQCLHTQYLLCLQLHTAVSPHTQYLLCLQLHTVVSPHTVLAVPTAALCSAYSRFILEIPNFPSNHPRIYFYMNVTGGTKTPNAVKIFLAVFAMSLGEYFSDVSKAPHDTSKRRELHGHRYGIPSETGVQQYRCKSLQYGLSSETSAPCTLCEPPPTRTLIRRLL